MITLSASICWSNWSPGRRRWWRTQDREISTLITYSSAISCCEKARKASSWSYQFCIHFQRQTKLRGVKKWPRPKGSKRFSMLKWNIQTYCEDLWRSATLSTPHVTAWLKSAWTQAAVAVDLFEELRMAGSPVLIRWDLQGAVWSYRDLWNEIGRGSQLDSYHPHVGSILSPLPVWLVWCPIQRQVSEKKHILSIFITS